VLQGLKFSPFEALTLDILPEATPHDWVLGKDESYG